MWFTNLCDQTLNSKELCHPRTVPEFQSKSGEMDVAIEVTIMSNSEVQ